MTSREDVLFDVDRNITAKVTMGTGQLVDVVGKRNLVVDTKMGRRYVKGVLLVAGLKENLLSVGQMMKHGYILIFGANKVEIYDDCSLSNLVAKVQMKGNISFTLKLHTTLHVALRANVESSTLVWHRRMGHLNFTSLKLLQDQGMVLGLLEIKLVTEVCEGCTFGKHCRDSFPKETTSRATIPLELVHTNVCGPMQTVTKAGNRDLIFNEAAVWDWNAQKECDISIPLNETLTEREEESSDSSLSQEEISEEGHVDPDSGSLDVDHTPLKYKSIAEVYARCNL
ncbi:hypothetical protein L3X38_027359 [Prunus dulcis]|uniref:GAG-pre-integrase domain-containing protein n=1 Tax=Prunus dulcis TaxID=3755 RepID=A0AAD4VMW7_PRUDU|nr:hypothetical protein L3X38_027359 [Prunus dulcis]